MATIWTELLLGQNGHGTPVGNGETECYVDPTGDRIFLKAQSSQMMNHFLTKAINQHLGNMRLQDISILEKIIDAEPAGIDQLLTAYRIPRSQEATLTLDEAGSERGGRD